MNPIDKEKAFAKRVNAINNELRDYDHDKNYFDECRILEVGQWRDSRTGKVIEKDIYKIYGRHFDFVKSFDHEPTDEEINNTLVEHFNLNLSYLKETKKTMVFYLDGEEIAQVTVQPNHLKKFENLIRHLCLYATKFSYNVQYTIN